MNIQISLEIMNEVQLKLSTFSQMHGNGDFDDFYEIVVCLQSNLFNLKIYVMDSLKPNTDRKKLFVPELWN